MGWATEEPWFDGPQQCQILLHSHSAKTGSETTPILPIQWSPRALFPGTKQSSREADHSHLSTTTDYSGWYLLTSCARSALSGIRIEVWDLLAVYVIAWKIKSFPLGCYATYIGIYRRFETTYLLPVDPWKWDRQVVAKFRCQSTLRNTPEERRSCYQYLDDLLGGSDETFRAHRQCRQTAFIIFLSGIDTSIVPTVYDTLE
jgi:hypothetical protein